jgi:hypothetical protein
MQAQKVGRGFRRDLSAGPLQDMISSFELHLLAERKSPKTIRTYTEAAQWFAAAFLLTAGVTGWAEVTARHVQLWIASLCARYSGTYANNQHRALQHSSAGMPARSRTARTRWPGCARPRPTRAPCRCLPRPS